MKRNRWGIAAAAVGIHICIGSVYAWSVLTKPIMEALGESLTLVQGTFSIAIFFLGMSAAFFGSFVERYGPKVSGLLSTSAFVTALWGTALAIEMKSLALLYAFYGVIGGIGLGVGYITPVSTLVKWFPRNRGFATGLAIMGFGFASLIAGPIMQKLYATVGLSKTFMVLGGAYLLIIVASAFYLKAPDEEPQLVDYKAVENKIHRPQMKQFTAEEALKDKRFALLWWILFVNITCGIGLLSVASPMAQEVVNMTASEAATMVGIIGLLNGLGRLGWASISDKMGRANTYIAFFVIQIIAFLLLAQTTEIILFQGLLFLIITCYGGGFATMPAYLSDLFGTKALSNIHGKVLTAWAMAGIMGPLLISYLRQTTAGFSMTLYVFTALFITALLATLLLKWKQKGVK